MLFLVGCIWGLDRVGVNKVDIGTCLVPILCKYFTRVVLKCKFNFSPIQLSECVALWFLAISNDFAEKGRL